MDTCGRSFGTLGCFQKTSRRQSAARPLSASGGSGKLLTVEGGDRRGGSELGRRLTALQRWVWLIAAALVVSLLPIVLAVTVHNHGSAADPDCVFHCYTLEHTAGPGVLAFVGAPAILSVAVWVVLRVRVTRDSESALRAAWWLASVSLFICIAGLVTSVGIAMLPAGVLTVWAVAVAPR